MVRQDRFRHLVDHDMPKNLVRVMAHAQRPAAFSALVVPAGEHAPPRGAVRDILRAPANRS